MPPVVDTSGEPAPSGRAPRSTIAVLTFAVLLSVAYVVFGGVLGGADPVAAPATDGDPASTTNVPTTIGEPTTTSTTAPITTTTTPATTTSSDVTTSTSRLPPGPPPVVERYVVPSSEIEPDAKQVAADIAAALTTYEETDDHPDRLRVLTGTTDVESLVEASRPLTYPGSWSRGEVVYPQLGGLTEDLASVMVVTRQTVGTGSTESFSVVRTLDVRLVRNADDWEFDRLSSAGGVFDDLEDLELAESVASDPRIEMPDSARLDIRSGLISPVLITVMAELAEQSPYGVVVLATGHPHHVFGTDRVSHHTVGQAVDIYRIGGVEVIDDRQEGSASFAAVEWLLARDEVIQVGSPWDLDGEEDRRSFANTVHQDHIHLAVTESAPAPESDE